MIRCDLFLEVRIILHPHEVFNIAESCLDNTVVISGSIELRTNELIHEFAGGGGIVGLLLISGQQRKSR
jgi:hypothetical protein